MHTAVAVMDLYAESKKLESAKVYPFEFRTAAVDTSTEAEQGGGSRQSSVSNREEWNRAQEQMKFDGKEYTSAAVANLVIFF